jgi:hypothetical protein
MKRREGTCRCMPHDCCCAEGHVGCLLQTAMDTCALEATVAPQTQRIHTRISHMPVQATVKCKQSANVDQHMTCLYRIEGEAVPTTRPERPYNRPKTYRRPDNQQKSLPSCSSMWVEHNCSIAPSVPIPAANMHPMGCDRLLTFSKASVCTKQNAVQNPYTTAWT